MASLQERNGSFRIIFSYQGKLHAFTIGKVELAEAEVEVDPIHWTKKGHS